MQHLIGARHRDDKSQSHLIIVFFDPEFFFTLFGVCNEFSVAFCLGEGKQQSERFFFLFSFGFNALWEPHRGCIFFFTALGWNGMMGSTMMLGRKEVSGCC
jgi:hypothetical protein